MQMLMMAVSTRTAVKVKKNSTATRVMTTRLVLTRCWMRWWMIWQKKKDLMRIV